MLLLALNELRQVKEASQEVSISWLTSFINHIMLRSRCDLLREKMKHVKSYKEWESYAKLLDHLEGHNWWKNERVSSSYDYDRIESRLLMMRHLRKKNNIKTLTHCLRQDLVKNIGRISNPCLYS